MGARRRRIVGLSAALAGLTSGVCLAAVPTATAAATDVVINELMYHAASDLDGDDYLELANTGATPVDVSGWTFGGVTLTLPAGTTIAPGGYLVVAKDAAQFQASYRFAPAAVYGGNLSNSGETLTLTDAAGNLVDTVTYGTDDPWPVTADGTGPSLELIDARLENDDALNWASATNVAGRTPGAANSVRRSGLGPRIADVTATPATPAANQPVTVSASITGQTSATLRYRIDFRAEQAVAMTSTGGSTFTATIPGAAAGHLLRYRVEATNASATSRSPRTDDTIDYRGLVVPSGISSPVPVLEWFIADADYDAMVDNPTADITRTAVLAYGGTVYDSVEANIKGHASQLDPKVSWKFHLPQNHDLDMPGVITEPVDEFDLQADWSDKSHGRSILAWDAYRRAGIVNHQMFPVRAQRNAAFQGLYTFNEVFDGTWREREGYDDKEVYAAETSAFTASRPVEVRFDKENPDDGDYTSLRAFLAGLGTTGTAQRDFLLANADLPKMLNYAAVTALVEHVDSSSKNFDLVLNPNTGRWKLIPWDLDHTWGNGCCSVDSDFVTPAEPGDRSSALMQALLAVPEWRAMYFRRLRTLVDDVLATGRPEALYDAVVGPAQPVATLDIATWPYPSGTTYATFRKRLLDALRERRAVLTGDSRVPASQPATPPMVIDEIQHSPASGDGAEFVELYNPGAQAVDLSGWTISGGIDLEIQPGTVIGPRAAMTFVSDDPAFRAAYSPTVFVGDRYDGSLAPTATLTVTRTDGSTADTLTYGGVGWPAPTTGQSLQLVDLSADNADGASWRLSSGAGNPGVVTSGPVSTVPASPVIGTPTQGAAGGALTAIARWTPPPSNGGSAITGYQVTALRMSSAAADATVVSRTTSRTLGPGVRQREFTLAAGTYRFEVVALNAVGASAPSARSAAVVPR